MTEAAPLTLDVRPILRDGGEPFAQIMQAIAGLKAGQALRLLTTFEPIPLYNVLGRKGFVPRAVRHGENDWEILFSPDVSASAELSHESPSVAASRVGLVAEWPEPRLVLDNRGMQPPEPMIRILSALDQLAQGEVLESWNDREPLFLYPELEARGAMINVRRESDGVRLLIRRGG
jgi:uncharacterized protein (DUF2249 family)